MSSDKVKNTFKKYIYASNDMLKKLEERGDIYEKQCKILKEENKKMKEGKNLTDIVDETMISLLNDAMQNIVRLDEKLRNENN